MILKLSPRDDLAERIDKVLENADQVLGDVVELLGVIELLQEYAEDKRRMDWLEANAYAIETRSSGTGHKPDVPLRTWIDTALSTDQRVSGDVPKGTPE